MIYGKSDSFVSLVGLLDLVPTGTSCVGLRISVWGRRPYLGTLGEWTSSGEGFAECDPSSHIKNIKGQTLSLLAAFCILIRSIVDCESRLAATCLRVSIRYSTGKTYKS